MNAEDREKIAARHERQCIALKEAFNVECVETFFLRG